jgi:hypothetical protein
MTRKKKTEKKDFTLNIPKREAGKAVKTDYMKNLRPFPSVHPVDDLLGLDTQRESGMHSGNQDLDTQNQNFEHPKIKSSDTQTEKIEKPGIKFLDTQITNSRQPAKENLDTQPSMHSAPNKTFFEQPDEGFLGTSTPKPRQDALKKEENLDTSAPESKVGGHSKNAKWRDYDRARSTVRVNLHISKEIDRKVRQYCLIDSDQKIELKEFYESAAVHYLDFLDTQNITNLGAETPLDDRRLKMLYKSKPFIINLYLRYNAVFNEFSASAKGKWAARWSPRDDEAAKRYNEISPSIVELGILQTQLNKGIGEGKIQTFKYYTEEIEKVLASGVSDEMLTTILEYHRQLWKAQTKREIDLSFLEGIS